MRLARQGFRYFPKSGMDIAKEFTHTFCWEPNMATSEATVTNESWVETVRVFLEQSRDSLPADLHSLLSEAIDGSHTSLLPRVFYEAVQQSAVAISITDARANILYANPAFTRITGYEPEEVFGKNESILSDNRTPHHIYENLWTTLLDKRPWSDILINRRKNGERYLAALTIAPVLDHRGEITHYLGMHRDVTEEHRLAREVRNNRELIESVVEAAPVVIALLDESGRVVRQNKAYRQLREAMEGLEPAERLWGHLHDERVGEGFKDRETRFDPGGGRAPRWFSCSCTPVDEVDTSAAGFFTSTNQRYRLLVAKDISDIKAGQEAVRMNALRALMVEDELVQSTRETLAGAIYQLQGPMNLVAAASNMIDRRGATVSIEHLNRVLREALQAGSEAMDRLNACMPASAAEAVTPVNINELLHDTLVLNTEKLLANGVVVEWKPTAVLPNVLGREHRLRGMLNQLIDNAVDAMSERGRVLRELTITTRQVDDDLIAITIDDTGPGIPEAERYQVFQPFYTTKGIKGKRAGMGLTMVQDVVSEHAGNIDIGTAPGGGCRVELMIALAGIPNGGDA